MMNVFVRNIHSLLGLSGTLDSSTTTTAADKINLAVGLGLITMAKEENNKVPNVLESARVKPTATTAKPNVVPAVEEVMSCTESLGFESCDERRLHDDDHMDEKGKAERDEAVWWRRTRYQKKAMSFPPPLSSFNVNGQPCFFLRPVRKNGRLELTEVRIHRPEIIHASRHDGRLTMHLIRDERELETEEEEEEEEDEVEEQEELSNVQEEKEETESDEIFEREDEEEEEGEEEEGKWKIAIAGRKGEGVRRCNQVVNHGGHHHHHHHHRLQMCGVGIM